MMMDKKNSSSVVPEPVGYRFASTDDHQEQLSHSNLGSNLQSTWNVVSADMKFDSWFLGGNNMPLAEGYRFKPTDEELISGYLDKKVKGEELPSNAVIDMDVYKHEPWSLWYHDMTDMNECDKYYFVERKKKSATGNGTTPKRVVESRGWWRANNNKLILDKQDNVIGSMMSLTYFSYKKGNQRSEGTIKTNWIMHEYKLKENAFQEWVLCRIRDGSKRRNKNLQLQISLINNTPINSYNQTDDQYLSTCGYLGSDDQVVAVGYRFEPTDEELVSGYLKRKLNGHEQLLPSNAVIDMDIYACEPWFLSYDIHGNMDNDKHEHDRYFFVNRHKKCAATDRGMRPDRDVKGKFDVGGYWKANSGDKSIRNTQHLNVIGYIKTLTFYKYKNKNRNRQECIKTDWIMHEYSLSRDTFQKWVLCRIRDHSKKSKEEGKRRKKNESCSTNITCEEHEKSNMEILETRDAKNVQDYLCEQNKEHFANSMSTYQELLEKQDTEIIHMSTHQDLNSAMACEEEGKFDIELKTAEAKDEDYLSWLDLICFSDHEEQQGHFVNMSQSQSHQELQQKQVQDLTSTITCQEQRKSDMELETRDTKNEEYLCEQHEHFANISHQESQEKSDMGITEMSTHQELKSTITRQEEGINSDMESESADAKDGELSWLDLIYFTDDEIPFVCSE